MVFRAKNIVCLALLLLTLTACQSIFDRFENVGKAPKLAQIQDPTTEPNYRPITTPLPQAPLPKQNEPNSLWQQGARSFFRDGRATRVGDILRVKIKITDQAEFNNTTTNSRTSSDKTDATSFFGLQKKLSALPGSPIPSELVNTSGSNSSQGNVTARRKETVQTQVAAMVTQVLPNGNFVIDGKQEFLMNYDIREVSISGIVRPGDIDSSNTIDSTQVAEARITYGGRGQNIDSQQPRWGTQVIQAISPF
jgi:flagellar L-ring protein precursor FlgH